jgi:hypothetical protein
MSDPVVVLKAPIRTDFGTRRSLTNIIVPISLIKDGLLDDPRYLSQCRVIFRDTP